VIINQVRFHKNFFAEKKVRHFFFCGFLGISEGKFKNTFNLNHLAVNTVPFSYTVCRQKGKINLMFWLTHMCGSRRRRAALRHAHALIRPTSTPQPLRHRYAEERSGFLQGCVFVRVAGVGRVAGEKCGESVALFSCLSHHNIDSCHTQNF